MEGLIYLGYALGLTLLIGLYFVLVKDGDDLTALLVFIIALGIPLFLIISIILTPWLFLIYLVITVVTFYFYKKYKNKYKNKEDDFINTIILGTNEHNSEKLNDKNNFIKCTEILVKYSNSKDFQEKTKFIPLLTKILNASEKKMIEEYLLTKYFVDYVIKKYSEKEFDIEVLKKLKEFNIYLSDTIIIREKIFLDNCAKEQIKNIYSDSDLYSDSEEFIALDYNKSKIIHYDAKSDIKKTVKYNDIIDCEKVINYEDSSTSTTTTKGGLGRAVVGGVLAGGAGAIVGAVTSNKETVTNTKSSIKNIEIKIITSNKDNSIINIKFNELDESEDLYSKMLGIINQNKNSEIKNVVLNKSIKEKLSELKELFENDLLTKEEYDSKRNRLLNNI